MLKAAVHLLLAVVGCVLVLPEHQGSLGLGAALQEGAAVLDAVHRLVQEGRLAVQLICTGKKSTVLLFVGRDGGYCAIRRSKSINRRVVFEQIISDCETPPMQTRSQKIITSSSGSS